MSNTEGIIIAVVVSAGVAAALWLAHRYKEKKKILSSLSELGIPGSKANFKHKYTTPDGARVKSTVVVPSFALGLIDEGLRNQIERHNRAYPNWANYREIKDYDILIIDPMATNVETEPGSPALLVHGYQTAGTCIGVFPLEPAKKPYIVAPHQSAQDWHFRNYFMSTIWFESEHVRESQNDRGVFDYYEGPNDAHPHVP